MNLYDIVAPMTMAEAQTDYQKRRQRERDVDAGRPVKASPKNPQTDYAKKRAQDKKDMALGEDSWHAGDNAWSSENHEMVEGQLSVGDPVIVTAPNEFEGKTGEVAEFSPSGKFVIVDLYNHGKHSMHLSDVEYNQYADEQEEDDWYDEGVAEGWSDAIVARRTGTPRTPYSVYIKGRKWKDFENDDHARAVMDKLITKFEAEGRDPSVITIAPTDYDKGVKETVWFPTVNVPKFPKSEVDNTKWVVTYKIPATGETKIVAVAGDTEKQARENLLARTPAAKIVSIKSKDMSEAIVASGPSQPLDDRAVRKMVWDTMKINADTGEQAIQRALAVLAKKPQSRMVQDLQDKFQSLADRLAQGVAEAGSPAQQAAIAIAKKKEQGIDEVKQRLDAKCWKGKHKEGTKIKGGIRVNNCVPNESVEEAISKKDLVKQVGDKLNDPEFRKQPADPTKSFTRGDHWKGAGPDDYGYTGYQGHGMPKDKPKKKTVKESYWTRLQNERSTKLNSLVNELKESIKK